VEAGKKERKEGERKTIYPSSAIKRGKDYAQEENGTRPPHLFTIKRSTRGKGKKKGGKTDSHLQAVVLYAAGRLKVKEGKKKVAEAPQVCASALGGW